MNDHELELLNLRKKVELLTKKYEEKMAIIQIHNYIFSLMGVDLDSLIQMEEKIISYRNDNYDILNSNEESLKEKAVCDLQNMIADTASDFVLGEANIEKYEEILRDEFGSIWNCLNDKSKSFLITAKITFNSLRIKDKEDNLDYSGVCLLVTKSLEVELLDIFFFEYIEYLRKMNTSINNYPDVLVYKGKIIDNERFNMGLVVPICGLGRSKDGSEIQVNNYSDFNLFIDYAKRSLYSYSENYIENELYDNIEFIEKVRKDYRNPCAHTGQLNRTLCKECMDYVVDVEKQLKRMVGNMNIRKRKIFEEERINNLLRRV